MEDADGEDTNNAAAPAEASANNAAAPAEAAPPAPVPKAATTTQQDADGDEVRALTMHEMVESHRSLSDHRVKLLMMTGRQARLVCDSAGAIDRMIAALGIRLGTGTGERRSQLVINLLESGGSHDYTTKVSDAARMVELNQRWAPGMVHGRAPFLDADDERQALGRIDLFMSEVLIPLAAQTQ